MKKIILSLLVLGSVVFSNHAQAQKHKRMSFYYYPESNVYYNPQTQEYAYADNGNWGYRHDLPNDVVVQHRSYVTVYGDDPEIWRENNAHREKYKGWKGKHKGKDRDRDDRERDRDRERDHD